MQNLINQKFGHLLVLEEADRGTKNRRRWKCRCDCGKITIIYMARINDYNWSPEKAITLTK